MSSSPIDDIIVGQSAPAKELKKLIGVVSNAPTSVLVLGETGTGKACRPSYPRSVGAKRQVGICELRGHTIRTARIRNFRA